jgi:hypothetical protein
MTVSSTFDPADRLRSFQLVAAHSDGQSSET